MKRGVGRLGILGLVGLHLWLVMAPWQAVAQEAPPFRVLRGPARAVWLARALATPAVTTLIEGLRPQGLTPVMAKAMVVEEQVSSPTGGTVRSVVMPLQGATAGPSSVLAARFQDKHFTGVVALVQGDEGWEGFTVDGAGQVVTTPQECLDVAREAFACCLSSFCELPPSIFICLQFAIAVFFECLLG